MSPVMKTLSFLAMALALLAMANAIALPRQAVFMPEKANFEENYWVRWANHHVNRVDGGKTIQLVLDKDSGAGFASKNRYLFGYVGMRLKFVSGESAGTVTAFYMSSETANHDELDFEFLGNTSGQPYIVQTNVFANGKGDKEQRHYLWFDPTKDFHTYAFLWTPKQIIFYVDDVPIRLVKNYKDSLGLDYPLYQPMGIFSSLWNGDDWATRGGLEKIKWNYAPFIASYRGFDIDACKWTGSVAACSSPNSKDWWRQDAYQKTDAETLNKLRWANKNYRIYDYCTDYKRFAKIPIECSQKV